MRDKPLQPGIRRRLQARRVKRRAEGDEHQRLIECTHRSEAAAHQVLSDGSEVILPLAGTIDVAKECARLQQELAALEKQLGALRQRLANENFVSRAKPEIVDAERQKEREWSGRCDQLAAKVKTLCGN